MSNALHGATLVAQATTSPAAPAAAAAAPAAQQAATAGAGVVQQSADALQSAAAALPPTAPVATPDMGFLHFVAQSDFVGKSLFIILILMSLVTWYLILVKAASNVSMRK
ncbi:MAG: MotA/TolQ/ExbB proton channel family protein, partial [Achromobacter piechaudii]